MKTSQIFLWVFAGIALCAGVILIGIGSSFIANQPASCTDELPESPTCDADGSGGTEDIEVYFDSKYFRVS